MQVQHNISISQPIEGLTTLFPQNKVSTENVMNFLGKINKKPLSPNVKLLKL